ncbi:hypothetical protein V2J09_013617 [Rumex salicifolius]
MAPIWGLKYFVLPLFYYYPEKVIKESEAFECLVVDYFRNLYRSLWRNFFLSLPHMAYFCGLSLTLG